MTHSSSDPAQSCWDSEKRNSPYSTVADPYGDDDYCELCDSTVVYAGPDDRHGTCNCDEKE